jgi:hypothetical protein
MREVSHSAPSGPSSRWHESCEEPWSEDELEVDLGDCRLRRGVHYSRATESFLDDDDGAVVRVVMWRFATLPH